MRPHWKYLTVTLVIGWFLGAASGLLIMHMRKTDSSPIKHSQQMREHFYNQLQLTEDQRTQADAILKTNRQRLDALFSETKQRVEDVRDSTRVQIRQLLTPDQQKTYDKLHAKWEERYKKRFDQLRDRF